MKGILKILLGIILALVLTVILFKISNAAMPNEKEITLDKEFVDDYYDNKLGKLQQIGEKIQNYTSDLIDFKESYEAKLKIKNGAEYSDITEFILMWRAIGDGGISYKDVFYMSNEIALFTRIDYKREDFDTLLDHLGRAINTLNYCVNNLNVILSSSKNSGFQILCSNLKDEIRDAEKIFEKIEEELKQNISK